MHTREVVEKGFASFQSGDISSLFALYDPNMEYHVTGSDKIPYAGVYKGLEEIQAFFGKLADYMEYTHFEVKDLICEGSKSIAIIEQAGLVKPTGKTFRFETIHLHEVEDGKFIRFKDFPDSAAIEAAFTP